MVGSWHPVEGVLSAYSVEKLFFLGQSNSCLKVLHSRNVLKAPSCRWIVKSTTKHLALHVAKKRPFEMVSEFMAGDDSIPVVDATGCQWLQWPNSRRFG